MRLEIMPEDLLSHLSKGEVIFHFEKLDGTLRASIGTTSPKILGEVSESKNPTSAIRYFDIEKNQWRSIAEGQRIYLDTEWIREIFSCPQLTDGEMLLMFYEKDMLDEDSWFYKLVTLIKEAPQTEILNLRNGYKDISTAIWKYMKEEDYRTHLEKNWEILLKLIKGEY